MRLPYKKLSLSEFEKTLTERYRGKLCSFTYPGYDIVYGICDNISIDMSKLPAQEIVIILGRSDGLYRYTCSVETLTECLKILKS